MGFLSNLFSGGADKANLPQLIQDGALLIDARGPQEFAGGHIENAVNIPHDRIAQKIGDHEADKSRSIVVYCHSGARSAMAVRALKKTGYTQVENGGGIHALNRRLGA